MKLARLGLAGLFVSAAVALSPSASADLIGGVVLAPIDLGTPIALECANPGSTQDVVKTPVLKNSAGYPLKSGMLVSWKSSDGDGGMFKLAADLAPGATLKVQGTKAGQAYTCTSQFMTRPDLVVTGLINAPYGFYVQLSNADPWVPAAASVTKVEIVACGDNHVINSFTSVPVGLAKGETKKLGFQAVIPPKAYVRVTADSQKEVVERIETNNIYDSMNTCLR